MQHMERRFLWGAQEIASAIDAKPRQVYRLANVLKSIKRKGGILVADREELIEEFRQLDTRPSPDARRAP